MSLMIKLKHANGNKILLNSLLGKKLIVYKNVLVDWHNCWLHLRLGLSLDGAALLDFSKNHRADVARHFGMVVHHHLHERDELLYNFPCRQTQVTLQAYCIIYLEQHRCKPQAIVASNIKIDVHPLEYCSISPGSC